MEETISLQEIVTLLKKKAVLILSMFFIGIGISALTTFMVITPKYSATSQLIATSQSKDNTNANTDSINSNLMMINTYKDFIKGRVVTEAAREQLEKEIGFKGTADDIKNMIAVEQTQQSQMFSIVVTSENPEEAATVANVVSDIFKKEAKEYTDADKVSVISKAEMPINPVSPNKKINLAIGGILGLIIGIGLSLLSQLFNRTVKSIDYMSDQLNIPILGSIPLMDDKSIAEVRKKQWAALEDANSTIEGSSDHYEFDLDDEVDGLEADLSSLRKDVNLEETIDLSELNITKIDLTNLENEADVLSKKPDHRRKR
ncbi:Wzz/FepE/Etk N-terminal domain-containing protein [Vagococcus carniphilus]|uniref:YveK family protein n=1 Tax=Vagococcus carniphilus TaxID=218144 RepID=UPI00288EA89F|nr:Wzz/FepE/Etk N-terminal domain-containing protein [Vagococcus carniphilus]MDT2813660.1 Wzz/FepE/Etk N-terminal domain-containing protein [Vagococcus carniphilus]